MTSAEVLDGSLTGADIGDGTIADADVSATAAIAGTKVSPDFGAQDIATTGSANIGSTNFANLATVDTVVDAIKVITDQMVFTKANELDVNTKSINDAEVVGDGSATGWDGV